MTDLKDMTNKKLLDKLISEIWPMKIKEIRAELLRRLPPTPTGDVVKTITMHIDDKGNEVCDDIHIQMLLDLAKQYGYMGWLDSKTPASYLIEALNSPTPTGDVGGITEARVDELLGELAGYDIVIPPMHQDDIEHKYSMRDVEEFKLLRAAVAAIEQRIDLLESENYHVSTLLDIESAKLATIERERDEMYDALYNDPDGETWYQRACEERQSRVALQRERDEARVEGEKWWETADTYKRERDEARADYLVIDKGVRDYCVLHDIGTRVDNLKALAQSLTADHKRLEQERDEARGLAVEFLTPRRMYGIKHNPLIESDDIDVSAGGGTVCRYCFKAIRPDAQCTNPDCPAVRVRAKGWTRRCRNERQHIRGS